jgi:HNH endonuclease
MNNQSRIALFNQLTKARQHIKNRSGLVLRQKDAETICAMLREAHRIIKEQPRPAPTPQGIVQLTREPPDKASELMRNRIERIQSHELSARSHAARRHDCTVEDVTHLSILLRDGDHCYLCGLWVSWKDCSFDHVTPLSRGGHHTLDNLKLTHHFCNNRKGSRLPSEIDSAEFAMSGAA